MDNFLSLLRSVNKISLMAFLMVLGFLGYEISLLKKETGKQQKPTLPEFDPNLKVEPMMQQITQSKKQISAEKPVNKTLIVILILMLIVFGAITMISLISISSGNKGSDDQSRIIIQTVDSKGIKLFDRQWNILDDARIRLLKEGDIVNVGVETVSETDIDKARIRINETNWKIDHITDKFNSQYNVFYREYQIVSNISRLQISAQLHSKQDGWLGD